MRKLLDCTCFLADGRIKQRDRGFSGGGDMLQLGLLLLFLLVVVVLFFLP